jgi:hypothetical protein
MSFAQQELHFSYLLAKKMGEKSKQKVRFRLEFIPHFAGVEMTTALLGQYKHSHLAHPLYCFGNVK